MPPRLSRRIHPRYVTERPIKFNIIWPNPTPLRSGLSFWAIQAKPWYARISSLVVLAWDMQGRGLLPQKAIGLLDLEVVEGRRGQGDADPAAALEENAVPVGEGAIQILKTQSARTLGRVARTKRARHARISLGCVSAERQGPWNCMEAEVA